MAQGVGVALGRARHDCRVAGSGRAFVAAAGGPWDDAALLVRPATVLLRVRGPLRGHDQSTVPAGGARGGGGTDMGGHGPCFSKTGPRLAGGRTTSGGGRLRRTSAPGGGRQRIARRVGGRGRLPGAPPWGLGGGGGFRPRSGRGGHCSGGGWTRRPAPLTRKCPGGKLYLAEGCAIITGGPAARQRAARKE